MFVNNRSNTDSIKCFGDHLYLILAYILIGDLAPSYLLMSIDVVADYLMRLFESQLLVPVGEGPFLEGGGPALAAVEPPDQLDVPALVAVQADHSVKLSRYKHLVQSLELTESSTNYNRFGINSNLPWLNDSEIFCIQLSESEEALGVLRVSFNFLQTTKAVL